MNKYAHLAPPPPRWQHRKCAVKIHFPSERVAIKAAARSAVKFGMPFRHYLCAMCLRWHVTKARTNPSKPEGVESAPRGDKTTDALAGLGTC